MMKENLENAVRMLKGEREFQQNRIQRLQERIDQIYDSMYAIGGRTTENPFTVREELAELHAKIKMAKKEIVFIDTVLAELE